MGEVLYLIVVPVNKINILQVCNFILSRSLKICIFPTFYITLYAVTFCCQLHQCHSELTSVEITQIYTGVTDRRVWPIAITPFLE